MIPNMEIPQPFILASSSAVRKKVLENHGIPFSAIESGIDEKSYIESHPIKRAQLLAREKALHVANAHNEAWVCGCDTVLMASNGEVLEKPRDSSDAERMMRLQSGQCTTIYTGMCIVPPRSILQQERELIQGLGEARMYFRSLGEDDIRWWLETQDWAGAAGAFRSQGQERLLSAYDGDPTLLDGFSMDCLKRLVKRALDFVH